jgi:hypothetical protein
MAVTPLKNPLELAKQTGVPPVGMGYRLFFIEPLPLPEGY